MKVKSSGLDRKTKEGIICCNAQAMRVELEDIMICCAAPPRIGLYL